jgi:hypothetical protein
MHLADKEISVLQNVKEGILVATHGSVLSSNFLTQLNSESH